MEINRTVQAIFDKAMYLMDAQNESTGNTDTSDTFALGEDGKRPALGDITDFTDELDLDARILRDVLPNGLAAKLLSEENPTLANYFQQCFEQSLVEARARIPARFESIDDSLPYGGLEYGEFGRW